MNLKAEKREILGKKVKNYRIEGKLPAAIFGPERPSTNILVSPLEVKKALKNFGYNQIFDIEIEGEKSPVKVLIKEIQANPVTDQYLHVAFYQIDMKKKIVVEVPVRIIGQSKAVKNNLGFLVHPIERVPVLCLPSNIPQYLEADISNLDNVNDSVTIADMVLPENVEWESNLSKNTTVARIAPPQKMLVEEVAQAAAAAEAATADEAKAKEASGSAKKS